MLLAVVMLTGLLPLAAHAIDLIEEGRKCSIEITFRFGEKDGEKNVPLEGAEFKLYRVATPDAQCHLTATEAFKSLTGHVNLNQMKNENNDWETLATKLAADVKAADMAPDYAVRTDENGRALAGGIEQGLYLIFSEPLVQDHGTFVHLPVLIMAPYRNQDTNKNDGDIDSWQYDRISLQGKPMEAKNKLKVRKFWKDSNNAAHLRPENLTIYLLANGRVYDEVKLPHQGKWEYQWENLPYGPIWSVREDTAKLEKIPYECGVPQESSAGDWLIWTITNRYTPPPAESFPRQASCGGRCR